MHGVSAGKPPLIVRHSWRSQVAWRAQATPGFPAHQVAGGAAAAPVRVRVTFHSQIHALPCRTSERFGAQASVLFYSPAFCRFTCHFDSRPRLFLVACVRATWTVLSVHSDGRGWGVKRSRSPCSRPHAGPPVHAHPYRARASSTCTRALPHPSCPSCVLVQVTREGQADV